MAVQATKLIKVALGIHCLSSLYMYSNEDMLSYVSENIILQQASELTYTYVRQFTGYDIGSLKDSKIRDYMSLN